ncbi:hypothetical protein BHE74_00047116 [Ensete ventricosum]|nr:hypothetical protein GW17_00056475 [Ensete ventricosum]RWW46931.1 hypothetical protein BHE74_00047116 [Ensete ventricosum]
MPDSDRIRTRFIRYRSCRTLSLCGGRRGGWGNCPLSSPSSRWRQSFGIGNRRFDMEKGKVLFTFCGFSYGFADFFGVRSSLSRCRRRSLGFYRDVVLLDLGDCVEFYAK